MSVLHGNTEVIRQCRPSDENSPSGNKITVFNPNATFSLERDARTRLDPQSLLLYRHRFADDSITAPDDIVRMGAQHREHKGENMQQNGHPHFILP